MSIQRLSNGPSSGLLLPSEIWLEIFAHLDYETLKCTIPLVSKYFKDLIVKESEGSHTPIDRILFCDAPIAINKSPTAKTLHPIFLDESFHSLQPFASASLSDSGILDLYKLDCSPPHAKRRPALRNNTTYCESNKTSNSTFQRQWLKQKAVWHENATSPASRNITVRCHYNITEDVTGNGIDMLRIRSDTQSITVFDVLMASEVLMYRLGNSTSEENNRFNPTTGTLTTLPVHGDELDQVVNRLLNGKWYHALQMKDIDSVTRKGFMDEWIMRMELHSKLSGPEEALDAFERILKK